MLHSSQIPLTAVGFRATEVCLVFRETTGFAAGGNALLTGTPSDGDTTSVVSGDGSNFWRLDICT